MKLTVLKKLIPLMCALLISAVLLNSAFPISAHAVSQSEIDELEEQKKKIAEEKELQQDIVDSLERDKADFLELKKALDDRNAYVLEEIRINQEEIDLYSEMIEKKSLEVDTAKAVEEEQLAKYRTRVRAMEENGQYDYLALFLNASSLSDLLSSIDDIGEIMTADKTLEDEYISSRENTESVRAEYEQYKLDLEKKQEELQNDLNDLMLQLEETEQLIVEMAEKIENEEDALDVLSQAEDETQAEIDRLTEELEKQKAAERAAQTSAQTGVTGYTGGEGVVGTMNFIWPVSCSYITSCVGYRWHPVSGVWKYHSGMDVGCQYGDPIWASDSGTVCIAEWYGGYGNCVMIDHNNGYYTLYGHMSSIAVSMNQTVSQGQVIGYVGSTGISTGPHLHFEIREGTNCLDFAYMFTNLTYASDSGG